MKRDGTVGRSDAIERNLPVHRDIDPARVMRPRFAEPIRASSPPGLHQQAGHMTASDNCSTRNKISCGAGAIHTLNIRHYQELLKLDRHTPETRQRLIDLLAEAQVRLPTAAANSRRDR